MAMNGTTLGQAMFTALKDELGWTPPSGDDDQAKAVFERLGQEIVDHITANAAVSGTATGVTSGPSSAPVTGSVS